MSVPILISITTKFTNQKTCKIRMFYLTSREQKRYVVRHGQNSGCNVNDDIDLDF